MPKSIYRLCTDDDVMSLAKDGTLNNAVSRASAAAFAGVGVGNKPRKKRGSFFRLGPVETVAMEAFNKLQTQGKIIYGIMRDHVGPLGGDIGRDEIRLVLEKRKSEIKTGQDVMRLFGFHMSQFYVKLGLVERVVEATGTETDETEAGDDE